MSIRKAKSLPLHALPRAAAPARSWCPASTRIARTPTRSIHRSAIRLDTKPTLKDGTAAKDLSELTLDDVQSASAELQSTDLLDVYNSLVARGLIVWDAEQVRCVMELRKLYDELKDYSPPLDLLRRLSPDAPVLAKRLRESANRDSWWNKIRKGRGAPESKDERERALVRVLSGEEELAELDVPKGILLTGPPGTGKSHLLSLFYTLLPTRAKSRQHYHPLLLSLYQSVWRRTQARMSAITPVKREENMETAGKDGWKSVFAGGAFAGQDPEGSTGIGGVTGIKMSGEEQREGISFGIARDMILEYHILYFDELQLVDATSAAMLRDVLSWYWRMGGIIIATSNRLPDDLYHHGVQKDRMNSFLEALKARCTVYELNGGRDWRLGRDEDIEGTDAEIAMAATNKRRTWFGYGDEEREGFEQAVEAVTQGRQGTSSSVNVYGRKVKIPWAVDKIAKFTFADLCEEALGTADYITIASNFETIIIDETPYMYLRHKNQARRLINLVDALYESKCKIIVSAEAGPEDIFFPDALNETARETNEEVMAQEALSDAVAAPFRPNVSSYAEPEQEQPSQDRQGDAARMFARRQPKVHPSEETTPAFKTLSIFTGEDERFAYKRAVSRLIEMTRSPTYAQEEWLPLQESHRRWEKVALSVPPVWRPLTGSMNVAKPSPGPGTSSDNPTNNASSDFADEAGYSRPQTLGPKVNRDPPKISEDHMWGVRDDWGKKAGDWGQGVKGKRSTKKDDEEK